MSAHRGRGRRKEHEEEEAENHERWAVSYADMMTVLVGLFIVLYSISQVDQAKFEELRQSLAVGFGHQAPSMLEGSTGALTGVEVTEITPELAPEAGAATTPVVTPTTVEGETEEERNLAAAAAEYDRLEAIANQVNDALMIQALNDRVRFRVTERGLIIGMVADDVFFTAASAQLSDTAGRVIDTITPVLVALPDEIAVEGHANILPVSGRYATNWELSADRATQVLRRMVEVGGLPGARVSATGFGDARPLDDPGLDPLEANRRVDVVVLSGLPEAIRMLLPVLAAQRG
jgi:chemotaxis protein MotB